MAASTAPSPNSSSVPSHDDYIQVSFSLDAEEGVVHLNCLSYVDLKRSLQSKQFHTRVRINLDVKDCLVADIIFATAKHELPSVGKILGKDTSLAFSK